MVWDGEMREDDGEMRMAVIDWIYTCVVCVCVVCVVCVCVGYSSSRSGLAGARTQQRTRIV